MNALCLLDNLKMLKNKSVLFLEGLESFNQHFSDTKKPVVFDIGLS